MTELIPPAPDKRVLLGTIVKVHGLRGDVKVAPLTWRPERFEHLQSIWVASDDEAPVLHTLKRVRVERGMVYLRFAELPRRDLVEPLVGRELFIDEKDREPLPEGYYYLDDLVGCRVHCSQYGNLGEVVEVMESRGNDVWIVRGPYGEVLVPAIQQVVQSVDIESRCIEVTLLEGLVEEKDEESPGRKSTPQV